MGRAIDMEKDIHSLNIKVERLENTMRGMCAKLDELNEVVFEYEEESEEITEEKKEKKDGKKANNKASSNSSKSNDGKNRNSKKLI